MIRKKPKPLLPGNTVMVRPLYEILSTLDQAGTLDRLPFMPEMAKYCGSSYTVYKRIERTCEEATGDMRRIQNVVFLDNLRCDGSEHGGCQKGCRIFWKEAWLIRPEYNMISPDEHAQGNKTVVSLPCKLPNGLYICQSTELVNATTPLSLMNLMLFVRDIRSRTYSILRLIRVLFHAFFLRLRYYLTGKSFRFLRGRQIHTPVESLGLQSGEWVRVKTKKEIEETLDRKGMNRGLGFTVDMIPDCGKTYRVLRRLEKMIDEPTRELIDLKDTVILENSVCHGCYILKGGCPRENFNFWREIWLQRAEQNLQAENRRRAHPDPLA